MGCSWDARFCVSTQAFLRNYFDLPSFYFQLSGSKKFWQLKIVKQLLPMPSCPCETPVLRMPWRRSAPLDVRKRLFRIAAKAFLWRETCFPAGWKRLFGTAKEPLRDGGNGCLVCRDRASGCMSDTSAYRSKSSYLLPSFLSCVKTAVFPGWRSTDIPVYSSFVHVVWPCFRHFRGQTAEYEFSRKTVEIFII